MTFFKGNKDNTETPHDVEQSQPHEEAPPRYADSQYRVLEVNFKWRKFNAVITEPARQDPVYLATFNPFSMKVKYRSGAAAAKAAALPEVDGKPSNVDGTDADIIGDGQVHPFKIDCQTHVHGRPVRVSAAKKWLTRYQYPSLAYATSPDKPAILTWKNSSNVKVFDFVLLDENDQTLAKFNPRYLGIRKMATIEIWGHKAHDQLAVDEVVITGLSLYFTMVYRTSSFVPFIGAVVARPGKDYKVTEKEARNTEESNVATGADDSFDTKNLKSEDHEKMWDSVNSGAGNGDS